MNRVCRSADKLVAFLVILTTALRGYVPEFRAGLRKLIWGLRILQGRCISGEEAFQLNVPKGSRPINDPDIDQSQLLITEGLSMIGGLFVCGIVSSYFTTQQFCYCSPGLHV